ncbi:branched-chain amino acid ABC transporter permease [Haloplanus pelagicus]|jgi:branched-chain amino acid transport system permease protein|uniref:branched-chain amino acid ABC transporter permease n=1 Tax=Haloplanus pelagicus TaxID=2949995 RepID=UPI002040EBDC|nr:branched-chain amino acid ABC transporter permease [Haloplanus sp. HW8-1]
MSTQVDDSTGLVSRIVRTVGTPKVYLSLVVLLLSLAIPVTFSSYISHIFILVFITGIGAVAWNIIGGFGGQFSLGNAVFYGLGAYSTAILVTDYGTGVIVATAVGVFLSVLAAVIIGFPTFKLSGHYFALATIAVVEGLFYLARFFGDLTGGSQGFTFIAPPWLSSLMLDKVAAFYIFLSFFVLAILISVWVRYSRLGYYLLAIREDQDAASALGVNTTRYKIYGFVLSAAMTAFAGSMHAAYTTFLSPGAAFSLDLSILYALIALVGGLGTIAGPIVGTLFMVPIQQYVTTVLGGNLGSLAYVGYGLLLILVIIYAPEGIVNRLSAVGGWITDVFPEVSPDAED